MDRRTLAETIFAKIDQAAVFVADVSIIGAAGDNNRYTPNPNVLVDNPLANFNPDGIGTR